MEPVGRITGIAVPFHRPNVDTDQIIPGRYIMKPRRFDYSTVLFHDLRFGSGAEAAFPLDQPRYHGAKVMITAENFACGSAREQAVYALQDWGIRAVVGPSFGGIFYVNGIKNGLLLAQVTPRFAAALCAALEDAPGATVDVDLPSQQVSGPGGLRAPFTIGPGDKAQLLSGKDDITRTLEHEVAILGHEASAAERCTWRRPEGFESQLRARRPFPIQPR
ncbi:MAG: 3-isopropylmalate dehydratase small subunit [bacterium]|jgi:3-isopropylmalate/(R)-2-methylmalate dehydratase small subunit|nr:3-isopropylmalate dehydratase small subunit [Betaproteobacteria bacterium]